MKSELSTIIDAAKDIRDSYNKYSVSEYMEDYDPQLLASIFDLIEALDEYDSIVENDEWHEN